MVSEMRTRWRAAMSPPDPLILLVAFLLIYGFAETDFRDFAALTAHPFRALADPGRQFLHSSPMIVFLGWPITRLAGHNVSFVLVTLGGFAAFGAGLAFAARPLSREGRRVAALTLLLSPLPLVLTSWLGKSDPYVLAFYLGFTRVRGENAATAILSLLMVFAHKEIGTVILIGDVLMRGRPPVAALAGFVAGTVLVFGYLSLLDAPIQSRLALGVVYLQPAIAGWAADPVTHIVLTFGWTWMLVFRRLREAGRARVAAAVLLCFVASFTAFDYTRVFALCAAPILLDIALRLGRDPGRAGPVGTWPFAGLCLVQAQVLGFSAVRDTHWLQKAYDSLRLAGWL